jgi:hypothetical protein
MLGLQPPRHTSTLPLDPQRSVVLRAVRARGHRRAHPRQDRRLEEERDVDGRRAGIGHRPASSSSSTARRKPCALFFAAMPNSDRAGLWLSPVRAQRSTARSSFGERPDFMGIGVAFSPTPSAALRYWNMARQRYCRCLAYLETPCASPPTPSPSQPRTAARKAGFSTLESSSDRPEHASSGRETDSPLEGAGFEPSDPLLGLTVGIVPFGLRGPFHASLPKQSSQRTQRWREQDSNHRSRATRPIFQCRLW